MPAAAVTLPIVAIVVKTVVAQRSAHGYEPMAMMSTLRAQCCMLHGFAATDRACRHGNVCMQVLYQRACRDRLCREQGTPACFWPAQTADVGSPSFLWLLLSKGYTMLADSCTHSKEDSYANAVRNRRANDHISALPHAITATHCPMHNAKGTWTTSAAATPTNTSTRPTLTSTSAETTTARRNTPQKGDASIRGCT